MDTRLGGCLVYLIYPDYAVSPIPLPKGGY